VAWERGTGCCSSDHKARRAPRCDARRQLLSTCENSEVLVSAATGRFGSRAAALADTVLADALNVACAQTTEAGVSFDGGTGPTFDGRWTVPGAGGPAFRAKLSAIGRLLPHGRFVEGTARLLDHTDALSECGDLRRNPFVRGVISAGLRGCGFS
jgi:hypothetical protein